MSFSTDDNIAAIGSSSSNDDKQADISRLISLFRDKHVGEIDLMIKKTREDRLTFLHLQDCAMEDSFRTMLEATENVQIIAETMQRLQEEIDPFKDVQLHFSPVHNEEVSPCEKAFNNIVHDQLDEVHGIFSILRNETEKTTSIYDPKTKEQKEFLSKVFKDILRNPETHSKELFKKAINGCPLMDGESTPSFTDIISENLKQTTELPKLADLLYFYHDYHSVIEDINILFKVVERENMLEIALLLNNNKKASSSLAFNFLEQFLKDKTKPVSRQYLFSLSKRIIALTTDPLPLKWTSELRRHFDCHEMTNNLLFYPIFGDSDSNDL